MTKAFLILVLALISSQRSCIRAYAPLAGITAQSLKTGETTDLSTFLTTTASKSNESNANDYSLLILGTYAADFNMIEYAQRLRYYLPDLKARGISKFGLVVNGDAPAAQTLAETVDLADDSVDIFTDPTGQAGRAFGVGRGWKPEDESLSPYLKLFGMLWGLGAWATLPAVIGGYIGNPFRPQPWIEDAMAVGQRKGRWPDTALDLDEVTGEILVNKFKELPVVGAWPRRPLELATLRLQNMMDISIKQWDDLKPSDESLKSGVLTQLGGCVIVKRATGEVVFEFKDPGICAVANFEDILEKMTVN
mmetsp:Transcript_42620/g.51157  ORF Transcript_42620/g.51157 Transcript_42620/m.51157 type:complete len:307 (+) Transcript_42620:36-956(+)